MLDQRRRRWTNMPTTLDEGLVFPWFILALSEFCTLFITVEKIGGTFNLKVTISTEHNNKFVELKV